MDVELLGPIRVGGEPLTSPTQSLLVCVLGAADSPVPFHRLIDAVWGAAPPAEAENSLHSHLSRLRRRVGEGSIERLGDAYRLTVDTDVARFTDLAAHTAAGTARRQRLERALAMWRGEPFSAHAEHPFLVGPGAVLRDLRRTVRRELAALDLATGRSAEALAACRALTGEDATDERSWTILVEALVALGRRRDALTAAQEARSALADVGLDVSAELLDAEAAAARGGSSGATAVPRAGSELIGRDDELRTLTSALGAPGWTTVIGPGGVGKTRLVIEVAGSGTIATSFVDLGQGDEADVVVAIARAVGAPLRPPYLRRVVERLGSAPHRLVLDGCELVARSVAELSGPLLDGCPELRVLVTSRVPIGVAGERVVDVGPLADAHAADLLVRRAREGGARPPSAEQAFELCGSVDRLPLNIEMLASALRSFSAPALLEALRDPIAVLGGPRGRLVAGVERSMSLLTDDELALFERLSVFRQPFTAEAATAVSGDDGVIHRLQRLRDLSLLMPVSGPTGDRLRMLDTVRAAAARSLARRTDADDTTRRYVDTMRTRAAAISSGLRTADEHRWATVADSEVVELRAAHRTAIEIGDADAAMSIPTALFTLVYDRLRADLATWAVESLDRFGDDPRTVGAAAVAALGAMHEDDHERARRWLEAVPPGAAGPGTHFGHLVAANLHLRDGDLDALDRRARRAREEASAAGDGYLAVVADVVLGLGACYRGDMDQAAEISARVRRAARRIEAPTLLAYADYVEGEMLSEDRPGEALELLWRSYRRAAATGSALAEGVALVTITSVRSRTTGAAALEEAGPDFERAIRHWRTCGDWNLQWSTLRNVVVFLETVGAPEHAAVLAGAIDAGAGAAYGLEARRYESAVERLRAALGSDVARLEARGRSLVGDEILEAALDALAGAGASA